MKKIGIWNNYDCFAKNQLFNPGAYGIGEDLGYPFMLLKKKLADLGYILETMDMSDLAEYEKLLFLDYPASFPGDLSIVEKQKKILFLTECLMIDRNNSDISKHSDFGTIYTYSDDFVNTYHYKKFYLPNKIKIPVQVRPFDKRKFCTLIAGNKTCNADGELYSERLKTIRFFEKKTDDFHLYGKGWDCPIDMFPNRWVHRIRRYTGFDDFFKYTASCYKGSITSKIQMLSDYKFCICYENTSVIPGYITEKLFDCFFAGVIPIYWGAPNVTDYIPADCFIDRRLFKTNAGLFRFLQSMSIYTMETYLKNILAFLRSPQAQLFSAEYYVETIIGEVVNG